MWKTSHGTPLAESLSCYLCPDCDSLGPHLIMVEDLPEDAWLACIDCGAALGRLTPQGIQTHAGPERMRPMADERPEPIDQEAVRRALVEPVPEVGLAFGATSTFNPMIALMGWRREAGER